MASGLRYATREELEWYIVDLDHRQLFLVNVQGLVDVEVASNSSGAFVLLKVQEGIDRSDLRSGTYEEAVEMMVFTTLSGERVRAKAKIDWI